MRLNFCCPVAWGLQSLTLDEPQLVRGLVTLPKRVRGLFQNDEIGRLKFPKEVIPAERVSTLKSESPAAEITLVRAMKLAVGRSNIIPDQDLGTRKPDGVVCRFVAKTASES